MELGLEVDDSRRPYTVLAVKGEVDVYTAPRLREKLVELVSQGKHQIVVDLEGVDFLDSTGLGVLVGAVAEDDGGAVPSQPLYHRTPNPTRAAGHQGRPPVEHPAHMPAVPRRRITARVCHSGDAHSRAGRGQASRG